MIHKLKYFFGAAVVFILLLFLNTNTFAQSQQDLTVCDFNPTEEKGIQVQLNYSCGNIQWLPKTYQIYRKINKDKVLCPANSQEAGETYRVDPAINGSSMLGSEGVVEDYMLFYSTMSMSERESVTWFEEQYKNNKTGLDLFNRKLPRPYFVDDQVLGSVSPETKAILEEYKGYIVCPIYEVRNGVYNTGNITAFTRADLVPPALQQFENMAVQLLYMIWALVFVYGMVRLTYLGFQFIYGGTSPERLGELRANVGLWFIGLIVIILAIPLLNYIYSLAGISTTSCYKLEDENNELVYDLSIPGFTFFFNDVCTSDIE
jgi:hypothetical protein